MPAPLPRARSGRALLQHAATLAALLILVANCADDQSTQAQRQQRQQPAQAQPTQAARPAAAGTLLTGRDALGDWTTDAPGVRRRITVADLPKPFATESVDNGPRLVKRPADAWPKAPAGFKVEEFAAGLENPRLLRVAPNGDIFVAESRAGRVRVLRARDGAGRAETSEVFVSDLDRPFGIAFYPLGPDPQYVYVANTGSVVRFPYRNGDLKARGPAPGTARGGRATRSSACRSATARRRASTKTSSSASSRRRATCGAAPSASRSRATARCSSRTTARTRSGASPIRAASRRARRAGLGGTDPADVATASPALN